MNRREDPLLRQHRNRLLQLAEATNIKPGRGSGKRRGQKQSQGFGPSNGGPSRVTLQDIVRNDPGYTPNIEHLVFPERKSSNPNLTGVADGSPPNKSKSNATSSGRSRLAEVFARHYVRGSSQDSSVTSRKNHVNSTSLDGGNVVGHQPGPSGPTVVTRSTGRRWLSQNSQSSRQHSAEDGIRGGSVGVGGPISTSSSSQAPGQTVPPALPPRRVNPATDTNEIANPISRIDRGPNVSILHLRNASADPWEVGSQGSSYSVSSNKSQTAGSRGKSRGNARGSYSRGSSIPSLKRHDTSTSTTSTSNLKQHRQDSHGQVSSSSRRREATNSFLSGNSGTSGELFISGDCSRELSPVRWCDREVDGVYLGRSGWVQVQQRSLDENRRATYESNLVTTTGTTLPISRRATIKLADYHCNSEPGKYPQDFARGFDSQRPDYLALHNQDFDSITTSACTSPHSIPESFSPPSITPIISPPPAFQDAVTGRKSSSSRHSSAGRSNYGSKAPFLPRSNAIVDSDIISPPPTPPPHQVNWSSLPSGSRKNLGSAPSRSKRQNPNQQQQQQQQQYRMAQAKSLEDQSSSRRSQFAQRYIESSSSSSSSMGFRSLDSCVTKSIMPSLAENTDSSVEGYEDGDEDDNPSSSLNLSLVSSSALALNSSTESIRANGERISPNRQGRIHRSQQGLRRSPGSSESGKQMFNSSSSSSSSSSSEERQGRSPTPNPFRRSNALRQHQSARTNQMSPDSHQSRVRRSRSLQLPEKRSPGTTGPQRDLSRESNEAHRVVMKIVNDRGNERSKRHVLQNRKAQSTDDAINENLLRETEVVTEYLYGTRSRVVPRSRYERRDENQEQRRGTSNTYDVYIISSKQQQQQHQSSKVFNSSQPQQQPQQSQQQQQQQQQQQSRRPRTLQRGATTPNTNAPSINQDFCISPDTKLRCNSSTCDFWPHCSQRETLYSPNQASQPVFMKLSQSYPAHQRLSDTGSHRGSASSSPASLERMDDRELRERDNLRKNRSNQQANSKYQDRSKGVLKQTNRWSPLEGINGNGSGVEKRDQMHHRVYRKPDFPGSFEGADKDRRMSPIQGMNVVSRSPSGGPIGSSSTTTSSSSSSDIWITTSDRTVTKSPRNPKSSGASTPMEDAVIGSLKTLIEPPKDGTLSRPGSAPTRGDDSLTDDIILDPHQRSLSLPKSFLTHNTADGSNKGSWHRGQDSQRSSPSPSRLHRVQEAATSHTAPVSPLHDYRTSGHAGRERRRIPGLSKAQRRIKASSTPALLDRNHDSQQWSGDEEDDGTRRGHVTTEHPLAEATIPLVSHSRLQEPSSVLNVANVPTGGSQNVAHRAQSQQESVLQKFRKSFSLRFHKKGSKESNEECPAEDNDGSGPLDEEESTETPPVTSSEQSNQHKDDSSNDQKFRFGPLVWRSSKERKKSNKAARNAKCNSGDSGIQIEMVSGGALTGGSGGGMIGGGDSSESHDTDDVPDDTDSPPALRRRVADKSRPQSELINQILIDKFKADLQNRASRHNHVRRTNSDLGGQRLLQWDTRSGYVHNYRRMLSTPSPIKTRPPRLSPRHSSHDIVTLKSNAKGRSSRTNLRRSLSQPLGINQLSPLMRTKTAVGARLPGGNVLSEDEQDGRAGTSDDEMMSDSESSIASLTDKKKSFEQTMDEEIVILAEAVWDHVAMEPEELAFRAGDVIDVLDTLDKDWWWGSCRGEHGWFPAAFVRLRVNQEDTVEDCLAAIASGGSSGTQLRRRTSVSLLSNEQVRTSVVRELVQTERDFVKVLRDVAEGYIAECRRRADMFTEEQIESIFINLEELLDFQSEFLKDLEACIDWNAPHKSCVGECFLNHRAGFRMYSEYCNSHPMAIATLQELYQHNRYSKFFEACRLMRGLIEIPLDGYLLTPVQRICKYPLQLAELLKYTKTDHPDYHKIQEALEAMRGVAVLINERKRRMESLEKLAAWQMRVEGWEGEDLIEVSSQLIYQGEAMRVKSGMWTNNITLFLFDHQLVYCKKDILKRNTYVYKGRIYLDTSEVIDVPDGKDLQSGVTVRHCLKIYSCVRDKWLLFCCRTAEEKRRWLTGMAEERRLVAQDRNDGLEFPSAARHLARLAASRQQNRPPIKPRNKTYKRESTYEMPTMIGQGTTNSLGRKVGTWFTFGSSKKSTRLQPS